LAAFTTEFIAGDILCAALWALENKLYTALTTKFPVIRIIRLTLRAFHFNAPY
jgi:hypothetical protein